MNTFWKDLLILTIDSRAFLHSERNILTVLITKGSASQAKS